MLDNVGFGSTPDVLPSYSTLRLRDARRARSPEARRQRAPRRDPRQAGVGRGDAAVRRALRRTHGRRSSRGAPASSSTTATASAATTATSGDRIALTVPLLGHYVTALYELSASGPYVAPAAQHDRSRAARAGEHRRRWRSRASTRPRRSDGKLRAGRTLVQYGLLASYRRQELDAPAWTQPGGLVRGYGAERLRRARPAELRRRRSGCWSTTAASAPSSRSATVIGRIGDATNAPGVSLREPVTSTQFGGVASLSYAFHWPLRAARRGRRRLGRRRARLRHRSAPGSSPAEGRSRRAAAAPARRHDHRQLPLPPRLPRRSDPVAAHRRRRSPTRVYVRPSVRLGSVRLGRTTTSRSRRRSIESNAIYATTPPGQASAPRRRDRSGGALPLRAGASRSALSYGVFVPGAGFRNLDLNLDPQPAQALELDPGVSDLMQERNNDAARINRSL